MGQLKRLLTRKINLSKSLFLKTVGLLFVPILGFVFFSFLTYPLKPHCSLANGFLGCTPKCEPTSFFEDGRPASYKIVPCFHEDPTNFQKNLFNNRFLIPLILFVFLTLWFYKEGGKQVIKRLMFIAFAPVYIFKENRQNKNFISRLAVVFILFFLFIEWALGYYVVATTILGKRVSNLSTPSNTATLQMSNTPNFTGQDILDAVNKYRKENNVPELKLDEVLCNNIAQRYLDIKNGEKENIAHKGFDEWYKKYVEPFGYSASENYAWGRTPQEVVKAWGGSPSHKLSILDPKNNLGCAYAAEGYAVLILGHKLSSQVKGAQNTDPIVNCQISPECGGGSRQMKLSECNNSTCCQIGDSWIFYEDKSKCVQAQNNPSIINSNSLRKNRVPIIVTDAAYAGTYYCFEDKVNEITRLQNLLNLNMKESKACFTLAKMKLDKCLEACKSDVDFYTCSDKCYPESGSEECSNTAIANLNKYRSELGVLLKNYCP